MTRMIITASLVQANGTEEQKKKFLPGLCTGEILAAAAFTEPDAGSDSAGIKCRAVKKGDKYVISGEKTWCTWANKAHLLCTTVVTNPEAPQQAQPPLHPPHSQDAGRRLPPAAARGQPDPDHRLQGDELATRCNSTATKRPPRTCSAASKARASTN